MTRTLTKVYLVSEEAKNRTCKKLITAPFVTNDDFKTIVTDSVYSVANALNVNESTVYSAIGREIGLNFGSYVDLLIQLLTKQNNQLTTQVISHRRLADNPVNITALFSAL